MQSHFHVPASAAGATPHARRLPSTRLLLGALLLAAGPVAAQSYAPTGVQQNVPQATVTGGGWSVCHSENFADSGTPVADILAGCDGSQVMLACRPVGAANYTLLAQAPRADVFFDTGDNRSVTRNANGVGWYFNGTLSMGFAPQDEPVNKNSCDYSENGNIPLTLPERLPQPGTINDGGHWILNNLPAGTYVWGVRAVDSAYAGGAMTTGTFALPLGTEFIFSDDFEA
jgi:hypothetical protein